LKWPIHKRVILNGLTFIVAEELGQKWQPKKRKAEASSRIPNGVFYKRHYAALCQTDSTASQEKV
jgi:hypothetical protein